MHQLRCFFAVLFAILIASPVCCCAAMVKMEAPAQHACCGHSDSKKEKKHHDDCDCSSKTPRIAEVHATAPHAPVFLAPEILTFQISPPKAEILTASFRVAIEKIDTGPPKRRLALLQRFLI